MSLGLLFGHEVSLMLKLSCLGYGTLVHCWSCLWCSTLSHHWSCLWGGTPFRHWSYLWWGTHCHHWFCLWQGTLTLPLVLSMIWLPPLIVGPVWDVDPFSLPVLSGMWFLLSLLVLSGMWFPILTASPVWDVSVLSGRGYPVIIAPVCDMVPPLTLSSVWDVVPLVLSVICMLFNHLGI